jgi:hypothetical protein
MGKTTSFVSEPSEITAAVHSIFSGATQVKCAVAYWGAGALTEVFKGVTTKDVSIIGDIYSGGCNPAELKKMIARYPGKMLHCDRLHAKVYLSNKGVVIGSANASTNGMGMEGKEAKAHSEAVLLSRDPDVKRDAREWFDRIKKSAAKNVVTKADIGKVRELWKRRKWNRGYAKSFVDAMEAGDFDRRERGVYVVTAMNANKAELDNGKKAVKKYKQKDSDKAKVLRDTDWYSDVAKVFPYDQFVYGFVVIENKIDWDGTFRIMPKNQTMTEGGNKYIFCTKLEGLPAHRDEIHQILKKLLGAKPLVGIKDEVIFKVTKSGLRLCWPAKLPGMKGKLLSCAQIRAMLGSAGR